MLKVPNEQLKNSTLLKKPLWVSIATLLMLVALSIPLITVLNKYHAEIVQQNFIEQESRILNDQIKQKIDIGGAIAVAYSQNSVIRDALLFEERAPIIKELKDMNRQFAQKSRFQNVQAHIITADGRSLVKTYDLDSYNQDLTNQELVRRAVATGKATAGINIGGAVNFFRVINIQPIYSLNNETEIIGFVGVSQGLRSVMESFATNQVDYALLSPVSNDVGSEERRFTKSTADYFKSSPLSGLVLDGKQLRSQNLYFFEDQVVFTQPVLDHENHILAAHAVSIPLEEYYDRIWQRNVDAIYILLAILLSTLSVSGLLLLVMKRSVIRPLAVFENTIRKIISSREYGTSVKIDSNDEIGRLSEQFNALLRQTEELIHSLEYQKEAIDSSLIVSRTDLYGTITYVNQQFERISGYSADELIGQSHSLVRHPDMPKETYKELWETIKSGKVWKGQIKNRAKDGSAYYVTTHILPIENLNGEVTEYLAIREDITELIELKESLQTAKEVAENASRAKSQFLSSMSHELRTPLNAIIGFTQLLEFSELNDKQKQQLQNIGNSGRHLLVLINDILELAKIESGNLEMSLEPVSLSELVKDSFSMVETLAKMKNVTLHSLEDGLDGFIIVDYTRVKQVLLNFLGNAIKYNRSHGDVFVYSETVEYDGLQWVQMHVKDTGLGISQKELKHLFEPFNRLGHENSSIEGTGIGLSIAKDLVEQMGGQIGVSSEEGVGSDFWFAFPLSESTPEPAVELPHEELSGLEGSEHASADVIKGSVMKRVLYIEDNPYNISLMEDIVETIDGVELTVSNSAEVGLEMAKRLIPDVMFIDINLPGMSGIELLPLLKEVSQIREKGTRFYALSANAMSDDVQDGMKVGFDRYLTKPIKVQEIVALLQERV